jgi:hypothetical protein
MNLLYENFWRFVVFAPFLAHLCELLPSLGDKVWLKLAKWFLTRRFLNDFLLIYA